jgi:hypothetical protein
VHRSLAVVLLLGLGCADEPYVLIWSSDRLGLIASAEDADRACAGSGPYLDAAAAAIAERLDVRGAPPVPYVWMPESLDHAPCSDLARGCATGDAIYARELWMDHEIVHHLARPLGRADPFLEEGLAEYLGGWRTTPALGDPVTFTAHQRRLSDPQFYPTSGRWVAEAVRRSSMDAVLDLYDASDFRDAPGTLEGLVESTLGMSFDDLHASIREAPACSAIAYREDPACSAEPIPWRANTWTFEYDVHCDDERVSGDRDRMLVEATLEMDESGRVRFAANEGDGMVIVPCVPACDAGDAISVPGGEHTTVDLLEGRYVVKARRTTPGPILVTGSRWF